MKDYSFKDLIGKKMLIKGGVGTGKTRLTEMLLQQSTQILPTGNITVIDLAPPRRFIGQLVIGGTLSVPNEVKYLRPSRIWAPRLDGKTKEEVVELAKSNAAAIEKIFDIYARAPTPVLFINDLTLYLHAGSMEVLLKAVKCADTLVCNAYEGHQLSEDKGSGISEREKKLLRDLERFMDIIVDLNK